MSVVVILQPERGRDEELARRLGYLLDSSNVVLLGGMTSYVSKIVVSYVSTVQCKLTYVDGYGGHFECRGDAGHPGLHRWVRVS